jgi:ABC-type dipeptide/oligopeptide/nickel transport system permease subunit
MLPRLYILSQCCIFATVLGLKLLGDGPRVALDPRMRSRGG